MRSIRWVYDRFREPFAPRQTPRPAPPVGIFDAPLRCAVINAAWLSHVTGAVEVLAESDAWEGDDTAKWAAIQEIEKFLNTLRNACDMITDIRVNGCSLQVEYDHSGAWVTVGDLSSCAVAGASVELRVNAGWVQWRQDDDDPTWTDLYPVPADGAGVELRINGDWVEWRQDDDDPTWAPLYPVPADGASVEMRVNAGWVEWRQDDDDPTWTQLHEVAAEGADGASVEMRLYNGWVQWRQDDDDPTWTDLYQVAVEMRAYTHIEGPHTGETWIQYRNLYDGAWHDLIDVADLTGDQGPAGADGASVELRTYTHVEGPYTGQTWIQWRQDDDDPSWTDLYRVPADGIDGASVELRINAGWVEWRQDDDDPTWAQLYEVPGDGTDGASAEFRTYAYVEGPKTGETWVQWRQDDDNPTWTDLYEVPEETGPGGANAEMRLYTYIEGEKIGETWVQWRQDDDDPSWTDLYQVPADGSSVELRVNAGWVEWRQEDDDPTWAQLYELPADGASVELRVNAGWVEWRQDDDDPTWMQLYELPADGASAEFRTYTYIEGPKTGETWVQWRQDDDDPTWTDLYEVPAETGPGGANAEMRLYTYTEGEKTGQTWVQWRQDDDDPTWTDLYQVPADGSSVELRVNAGWVEWRQEDDDPTWAQLYEVPAAGTTSDLRVVDGWLEWRPDAGQDYERLAFLNPQGDAFDCADCDPRYDEDNQLTPPTPDPGAEEACILAEALAVHVQEFVDEMKWAASTAETATGLFSRLLNLASRVLDFVGGAQKLFEVSQSIIQLTPAQIDAIFDAQYFAHLRWSAYCCLKNRELTSWNARAVQCLEDNVANLMTGHAETFTWNLVHYLGPVGLNNLVSIYSITTADCSGFEACTEPVPHTDCFPVPVDAGYGGVVAQDEVNVYRIFCDVPTLPPGGLGQPLYRMRVTFLPTNGLECTCCTVRLVDDSGFHGSLFIRDTVTLCVTGAVSVHKPADPAAWRAAINDQCIQALDLYGDSPWELFVELTDCCKEPDQPLEITGWPGAGEVYPPVTYDGDGWFTIGSEPSNDGTHYVSGYKHVTPAVCVEILDAQTTGWTTGGQDAIHQGYGCPPTWDSYSNQPAWTDPAEWLPGKQTYSEASPTRDSWRHGVWVKSATPFTLRVKLAII